MNVASWLHRLARLDGDRPAILHGTTIWRSYRELESAARTLASMLAARHGVGSGDRVAVCLPNDVRYFEILFAVWWLGAVAVPVNAKLHAREVAAMLTQVDCRVAFVGAGLAAGLEAEPGPRTALWRVDADSLVEATGADATAPPTPQTCRVDTLAWLFFTSGTTGRPKAAMLTHGNLAAMTACYFTDIASIEPDDHWLYAAPISHAAGFYGLPHFLMGARHVVPASAGFEPAEILDLAESLGRVSLFAAPTMVRRLVDEAKTGGRTGDGIRTIVYGGGPMYVADLEEALGVFGQRFVQLYGQGESPMTITALGRSAHARALAAGDRHRLGSVGVAQSLVDVRIAREDGTVAAPGEIGEVTVRGPTVMHGYWRDPEATANALRDGWLWTGDLGEMDADGFVTLRDRSKDLIISGGSNIYPREIEELLLNHPAIAEIAVVGRPDPEWGEVPVAFYVARTDIPIESAELDRLCLDNIARYKRPRTYRRLDELPKNHYGKVLKTELKALLS